MVVLKLLEKEINLHLEIYNVKYLKIQIEMKKTGFGFRNDGTKDSFIQLKNKTPIQTNWNKRISTDTEKE